MNVVRSQIREEIAERGLRTSSDFYAVLSEKVGELLDDAVRRAKANSRKTVMSSDL